MTVDAQHKVLNAESTYKDAAAIPLPPASQPETEVHFSQLLHILMLELETAKTSVDVAVSWFTNHDLYRLLGKLSEKGIQIRLVINNDSVNNR
jgi:phosphatidylserine/phosphatidylglycerophosphate/cardiolipin synthase-like enzyme